MTNCTPVEATAPDGTRWQFVPFEGERDRWVGECWTGAYWWFRGSFVCESSDPAELLKAATDFFENERWTPYYLTVPELRALQWSTWLPRNYERLAAPGAIEVASLYECRALWSAIHRKDRFCDGTVRAAEKRGIMDRLKTRIDQLLAEEDSA